MRSKLLSSLIAATLVLSACTGSEPPSDPGESSAPPVSAAPREPGRSGTPTSSSSPAGSASPTTFATAVTDEEAIIADLLREPGPYSGDAFDLDAVVSAVKQQGPGTPQEWAEAIVDATHGDYAEATQGLLDFDPSIGEGPAQPAEKLDGVEVVGQNHFAVVLDASGSMAETSGGGTRMQQAKTAIEQFASKLPPSSTLSLRVYGHDGSNSSADKKKSCDATAVVYEGEPQGVGPAMSTFEPTGWTPLAKSILAAREDIPSEASDAIVYVVTDGIETCGGDPVEAARQLAEAGVQPVVNVIGFQVGNADQEQLRQIAEAGGGDFTDVGSGTDLENYWDAERQRMMEAWREWQDNALARIKEEGNANMRAAKDFGDIIQSGVTKEGDDQETVINALADEESLDFEAESAVSSILFHRETALWSWSVDRSTRLWSESFDVQTSRWNEAYDLGSGKWSEYYSKDR